MKKKYQKKISSWAPVSLMNTYVDRMLRLKGKPDWRAQMMYEELYYRLMRPECYPKDQQELMRYTVCLP